MSVVVLSQDCPIRTVGSQSLLQNVSFNLLKPTGNFTYHQVYLRTCFSYSMEHGPSGEANRFSVKFPAFYGTRRFITAFTRARYLSAS